MRTAEEFEQFYATPDPWKVSASRFRDRVLRRLISKRVRGLDVLELGCGEGHLTEAVFNSAGSVSGIDISRSAIDRAKFRNLRYATFEVGDFLTSSFRGFDVIAALECIYYLSGQEQTEFFKKVSEEHAGKLLFISAPIVGENKYRRYFTHREIMATIDCYNMELEAFHNLNVNRTNVPTTIATIATRIAPMLLEYLPESLIYQRLYRIRVK